MPRTQLPHAQLTQVTERVDQEQIVPLDPLAGLISINSERLSGVPCFAGTRVPIKHLWDYLEADEPLAEFLEGFPGVSREQAVAVLKTAYQRLLESLPPL